MSNKRQQWELIKQEAPVLADFLSQVNIAFGKPVAVDIELASGEKIQIGVVNRVLNVDYKRGV